jgi:hypothetical protein
MMADGARTPDPEEPHMRDRDPDHPLTVRVGHRELVIRRRYEVFSILNDVLIALWFIAGSIMFFFQELMTAGIWCFLAGSLELLIRPLIRLGRHLHLSRVRAGRRHAGMAAETSMDF